MMLHILDSTHINHISYKLKSIFGYLITFFCCRQHKNYNNAFWIPHIHIHYLKFNLIIIIAYIFNSGSSQPFLDSFEIFSITDIL